MLYAITVPGPWINFEVLATLGVCLGVSAVIFRALVRRWESHRQSTALADWADEHGFRPVEFEPGRLPPPLDALSARRAAVRLCLSSESALVLRLQTAAPPNPDGTPAIEGTVTWHLLVRHLPATTWRPTGLRPASRRHSILDLYSLSSFPLLGAPERFMIFGTDSADARALASSMTRSLLPPDIGLLLHGCELVLDFSDRPFDEIEFNRMLGIAEQVAEKLPTPL